MTFREDGLQLAMNTIHVSNFEMRWPLDTGAYGLRCSSQHFDLFNFLPLRRICSSHYQSSTHIEVSTSSGCT